MTTKKPLDVKFLLYNPKYWLMVLSVNNKLYKYYDISPYIKDRFLKTLKRNKGKAMAFIRKFKREIADPGELLHV